MFDDLSGARRQALGIEWPRTGNPGTVRVLGDGQPVGQDLLSKPVAKPGTAARHGRAICGLQQMADQAAGDAFVIEHGKGAGFGLSRTGAGKGAFSGAMSDVVGFRQVGTVNSAFAAIVTLHFEALAGNGDAIGGVRRVLPSARKTVGGSKMKCAPRE